MRKYELILLGMVLSFPIFGQWIDYEDNKAGFRISLPGKPVIREDSLDAAIGISYIKSLTVSEGEGIYAKVYLANFTLYSESVNLDSEDSTDYFICQTIIDQINTQLDHSVILYNENTIINGFNAKIAAIRYGLDSSTLRMAFIHNRNKLMTLQYYASKETGMSNEAEKFFYSFEFNN
ncbi:MAG: hypothetical protein IT267_04205 [Saprospiraceae bacterium]|nr:hypothetical protein [Saprospiraceae bacterium]